MWTDAESLGADTFDEACGLIGIVEEAHHHELIAAHTRGEITGPGRGGQHCRDGADGFVSGVVPQPVVGLFQLVHVNEHHRDNSGRPLPGQQGAQRHLYTTTVQ